MRPIRLARADAVPFVAGHFGEWLQGRLGPHGPVALVTLHCPVQGVTVERVGPGPFRIEQAPFVLDEGRAAAFLASLGRPAEGRFRLITPLPPGGGAGVSTASLVALARAAGAEEDGIAAACLAAEGASDPLMLERPDRVLWDPRNAKMLEGIPAPPSCEVLGGFFGPPLRTDPGDSDFPDIADLVGRWRGADGDLATCAALASLSAERCTALRGPAGDPTPALARDLGALGHARAHTGSARALIFTLGTAPVGAEAALAATGLTGIVRFATGRAA